MHCNHQRHHGKAQPARPVATRGLANPYLRRDTAEWHPTGAASESWRELVAHLVSARGPDDILGRISAQAVLQAVEVGGDDRLLWLRAKHAVDRQAIEAEYLPQLRQLCNQRGLEVELLAEVQP